MLFGKRWDWNDLECPGYKYLDGILARQPEIIDHLELPFERNTPRGGLESLLYLGFETASDEIVGGIPLVQCEFRSLDGSSHLFQIHADFDILLKSVPAAIEEDLLIGFGDFADGFRQAGTRDCKGPLLFGDPRSQLDLSLARALYIPAAEDDGERVPRELEIGHLLSESQLAIIDQHLLSGSVDECFPVLSVDRDDPGFSQDLPGDPSSEGIDLVVGAFASVDRNEHRTIFGHPRGDDESFVVAVA